MAEPATYARRSFVYRELAARGARFRKVAGAALALDFGEPEDERRALENLGLCDLSPLPRIGFKGRSALDWLRTKRVGGLDRDNRADILKNGALAARLAPTEALILGNLKGRGDLCARLEAAFAADPQPGCYKVMRRDGSFHFLLGGAQAADAMATLCGVDLRSRNFPAGSVAQTSVARMSMIVDRRRARRGSGFPPARRQRVRRLCLERARRRHDGVRRHTGRPRRGAPRRRHRSRSGLVGSVRVVVPRPGLSPRNKAGVAALVLPPVEASAGHRGLHWRETRLIPARNAG